MAAIARQLFTQVQASAAFEMPASAVELADAKADFLAFLKSEDAGLFIGNIIDLGDALKKISPTDVNVKETIFIAIFQQANEAGHLKKLTEVFFNRGIDQRAFIEDLVQQTIVYAAKVETDDGVYVEPSNADIEVALAEVVKFIHSDDFRLLTTYPLDEFKKKLALIDRRSKGDEFVAYVTDYPNSPGYSKLFSDLIRDAAENGSITEKTRNIFFSPRFNQLKFIKSIKQML
jgi:hypothetical protein